MTLEAVWTIADIFNALMALPNLIALLALSGVIVTETRDYFNGPTDSQGMLKGEHDVVSVNEMVGK